MTGGEDEIPKWQREIIEGLGSVLSEVKILQKEVATLKSERRPTVDTGNVSARSSIESASSDQPKISDSIKGYNTHSWRRLEPKSGYYWRELCKY